MILSAIGATTVMYGCRNDHKTKAGENTPSTFEVECDRFADLQVLRYEIPGFSELTPQQKELAYYLYEAANAGRDIIYDQNNKHNLTVRRTIEAIFESNKKADTASADWKNFEVYSKRFFFSNGVHHHYSNIKFVPERN